MGTDERMCGVLFLLTGPSRGRSVPGLGHSWRRHLDTVLSMCHQCPVWTALLARQEQQRLDSHPGGRGAAGGGGCLGPPAPKLIFAYLQIVFLLLARKGSPPLLSAPLPCTPWVGTRVRPWEACGGSIARGRERAALAVVMVLDVVHAGVLPSLGTPCATAGYSPFQPGLQHGAVRVPQARVRRRHVLPFTP